MMKEAVISQQCSFKISECRFTCTSKVHPYERHGLCGKSSNHGKGEAKAAFLKFVDNNIQRNGKHAGSYGPQYYFFPQFTTIGPPKASEVK